MRGKCGLAPVDGSGQGTREPVPRVPSMKILFLWHIDLLRFLPFFHNALSTSGFHPIPFKVAIWLHGIDPPGRRWSVGTPQRTFVLLMLVDVNGVTGVLGAVILPSATRVASRPVGILYITLYLGGGRTVLPDDRFKLLRPFHGLLKRARVVGTQCYLQLRGAEPFYVIIHRVKALRQHACLQLEGEEFLIIFMQGPVAPLTLLQLEKVASLRSPKILNQALLQLLIRPVLALIVVGTSEHFRSLG